METKQVKVVVSALALAMMVLLAIVSQAADPPQGTPVDGDIGLLADDPRTAISSTRTISSPGSYYLTGDLQTSSGNSNAIHIDADNVTLDLMGFSLIGQGSGTGNGILISGQANVEIRNGTVRDFGGCGILENSQENGVGHRVIEVRTMFNVEGGIYLDGSNHLVRDSVALVNGAVGIAAGNSSTVINSRSSINFGFGVLCMSGTISSNTVEFNLLHGIAIVDKSVVTNNKVNNNSEGIYIDGDGSLIKCNTLAENIENNIHVNGSHNVIEENFVYNSNRGIRFEQGGNFYANNRASENGTNYSNTSGNNNGGGNVSF